jgi:hypothetical protein
VTAAFNRTLLRIRAGASYFFAVRFLDVPFLRGTFAPDFRASESPIAIACFRLVTFLPERPLLNVPFFRLCIARFTFCAAFLPYLAIAVPFCDATSFPSSGTKRELR